MNLYYRYLFKDSTGATFSSVDAGGMNGSFQNSQIQIIDYPRKSTIDVKYLFENSEKYSEDFVYISALENTINFYKANSRYYNIDFYKTGNPLTIIGIPSAFFGTSINRGSVSLKIFYNGTKIQEISDYKQNGELITQDNFTMGIVLYNEGFIILNSMYKTPESSFYPLPPNPESSWSLLGGWEDWGKPDENLTYDLDFEGTTKINTLTMFANAPASELNFSQNPTFIEYGQTKTIISSSKQYIEDQYIKVKDTSEQKFDSSGSFFNRQTFINKIGIYDENKKLIAIAKLATPVKKTENRNLTFKLKLDT